MTVHLEIFAAGARPAEDVWALVGDPWQLPVWTDVERVEAVAPEPLVVGSEVTLHFGGQQHTWWVSTVEPRLLEARTDLANGQLGVGVHVQRNDGGARVVLVASFEGRSRWSELAFRLRGGARLLRSFDRWARAAVAAPR